MIRRSVKIQLVAFALISVLGIVYVGTNYIGLHLLGGGPFTVHMYLPESGGIFTNAEVTERGVTVGRVGGMRVRADSAHCGSAASGLARRPWPRTRTDPLQYGIRRADPPKRSCAYH